MNRFTRALALWDAVAAEGARLEIADGQLELIGRISDDLRARVSWFCGGPELDKDAAQAVAGQVARSLAQSVDGKVDAATAADQVDLGPLDQTLSRARFQGARYRALVAIAKAPNRATKELLTLPVAYAVGLPWPFTVRFVRGPHRAIVTTARAVFEDATRRGIPAFVMRELALIARAAAQGRASGADLDRWLQAKTATPGLVLTADQVGALEHLEDADDLGLSFGELFDLLGAELVGLGMHEPPPNKEPG